MLVVDDEYELMAALVETLELEGYEAVGSTSGAQALQILKTREFDILLTDLMMPGLDGLAVLRQALEHDPYLVGVLMTGQGTVSTAVEAMKLGAFDYLLKPFRMASVLPMLERALQLRRLRQENLQLHQVVAIYDLSQTIASALDARTILDKTAEAAHNQTGADEVSILLLAPGDAALEVAALRRAPGGGLALGQRLPLEAGIAGWVAREQQPLLLIGPVADKRFQPLYPRPEIQAAICMPMLSAGRLVGVLNVNSLEAGRPFTPAHLRALSILASTAAAALQSAALFERSERLRRYNESILETIAEGLLLVDHRGRITYVNGGGLRLSGYRADEVLGRHWLRFVATIERTAVRQQITAQLDRAETHVEGRFVARDGREIPVLLSTTPFFQPGEPPGMLAVFTDITQQKQTEAQLRLQADLLYAVGQAVVGTDLDGNINYWNTFAEKLYGWSAAEALGQNVREVAHSEDARLLTPLIMAEMLQGRTWSGEFRVERRDGSLVPTQATQSPVHDPNGKLVGIIGISQDITERYQRERELAAISAVSAALRTAQARSEMVPVVLDELLGLLGAAGTALGSYDAASGERVVELARGAWADITGHRLAAASELDGGVFASGQPFVTGQAADDPRLALLLAGGQVGAIACLPLIANGQTTGALWVGRATAFTAGELRLLIALTNIAANALHRVTLHEQVEQRLERLAALRAIDRAIGASLDLRVALNVLLDQVMGQLAVDAAAVLLLNPHTRTLEYAARRGFRTSGDRKRGGLAQDYAGRAVLERRLVSVPDTAAPDPAAARLPLPAGEAFRAYFGAPLIAKGSVVGVLEVYQRQPVQPLPEWLEFLDALAELAAIAIDNARLFDSLQQSNLNLTVAYDATIEGWSRALDLRDKETEGHTQRVTQLCVQLARALGLPEEELVHVRRGGLLHDIGKMG
ncbi:MAG: PAS domain S-box protein, partial [Anaerolineales bacterium]